MSNTIPATILIIDDSEANRYTMGSILKNAGYTIWEAANKKQGMEYSLKKPDVVILDVQLPDGNGFEICHEFKNNPTTKLLPVLMVSAAFVNPVDKVHGLDSGADGYLMTPIYPLELVATVKSLLRVREVEKELSKAQDILLDQNKRLSVLYEAAAHLLLAEDNDQLIRDLFKKASEHLELDIYLSYLVTEKEDGLCLDSYAGISAETAESLRHILFGEGGDKAALFKIPIIFTYIQDSSNQETKLLKEIGVRAIIYAPLMVGTKLLGTLAFATRRINSFSTMDLELLKTIAHYVAIAMNRLRIESKLREARDKAESDSLAKSSFLANMSHEIRTPMSSIIGTTELLYNTALTKEQQEYAHTIYQAGDALLTLIDDILDFSKIEAGEMDLHPAPFKIKTLLDDIIQTFEIRAKKNHVKLSAECGEDVPYWLIGDLKRLKQILLNLIGNAIKFTKEGFITVKVKNTLQTDDMVTLSFEVEDTGIGISPDKLDTIFEKFIQAESFTNKRFGGTGLGLAISKQLVELMGGKLGVKSTLGKGSCFWFIIPFSYVNKQMPAYMKDMTEGESTQEETRLSVMNSRKITQITSKFSGRVLVAEDYLPNQRMEKLMLEKMGCSVDVVSDGEEALEKIKSNRYDIIFMDCQMPEMDGFEATRLIRQDKNISHNIIVAMTANALEGDRERCLAAGMDDYISKPIGLAEIEKVLQKYLVPLKQVTSDEYTP